MNPIRLTSLTLVCLALTASAQTPAIVNGQKVLLDKSGNISPIARTTSPVAPAPLVGGADDCMTPDVIVGTGTFVYDNTTATTGTDGQNEALCLAFASTVIASDVWFTWTATFSGFARMQTCNLSTTDTRLAAYAGTACPTAGSALACSDDACAFQSSITFPVTMGNAYVLQLGNYNGPTGVPGTGSFMLDQAPPPPSNDDCTTPIVLPGPGVYNFDNTDATTSPQGQATAGCGPSVNFYKDVWYTYQATMGGMATITTCGFINPSSSSFDTKIQVFDGAGCPVNPSLLCVDDASCATQSGLTSTLTWLTTCGQTYTIQLGQYAAAASISGMFDISETGTPCGPVGQPYCFGDGTGTACPCANNGAAGNGCASSVNPNGGNLSTSGNANLGNDTLALLGSGMSNSTCLYFQGTSQISVVFGDGLRCAGGAVTRLGTKLNAAGSSQYPAGTDVPISVKGGVMTPGSRVYQVWYRNAAAFCSPSTFNLTNGILINWM